MKMMERDVPSLSTFEYIALSVMLRYMNVSQSIPDQPAVTGLFTHTWR